MDRLRITFAMFVLASFGLLFCTSIASSQALLTTDMLDYSPGETAVFTGSGFFADESVTVQVLHADGSPSTGDDHEPWTVTADSSGNFITTWHVCTDDCLGALLRATAVGLSSGLSAEALFTDGPTPDYTASITPTTGLTGSPVAYTLTVTNIVTSGQDVGSVSVAIPTGAGTPSSVTVSAFDPGPIARTWVLDGSPPAGFIRFSRSGASANDIGPGGTIVIGFTATATTTGSKTWTTVAYKNNNYTSGGVLTGTQPVVTICSAITVSTNPVDQTVCAGSSASFSAAASGTPTPTLQWQVSTDGGSTWSNVAGATSSPLTFTTTASQNGNKYRAVFSNTCSSTNSTSATLTVNMKPVITCPVSFSVNNDLGTCGAVVNFTGARSATATGSPAPVIVYTPASGSVFAVGTTTVKAKATNSCGADSCTFTVTVVDNQKPSITCPLNIVKGTDAGNCSAVVSFSIISSDNCPGVSVSSSPASGSVFSLGVTTVKSIVTDAAGNKDSCTFTVTVIDTTKPNAQCKPVTLYLNGSGSASLTAAQVNNGSSDACGIKSIAIDKTSFTCSDVGANTVTLTVTDNNDNVSTCRSTVTVIDTVKPNAQCQAVTLHLDASGNVSLTAAQVNNGSSDACGIKSIAIDKTSFTCSDVGANTVTLTVTDNNDNVSTCTATVTVIDTVKPNAQCKPVTLYLNGSGSASLTAAQVNNGSSDACGIKSIAIDKTSFTCSDVGANTVTLTVTDNNDNVSTCTSTVTVIDTVKPNAQCKAVTLYLDGSGSVSLTAAQVNNGSSDACGIKSIAIDKTSFTCSNVGANTVTLTVTDNNDNVSTCTSTVTVIDTVKPNAQCKPVTLYLNGSGSASLTAAQVNNGSSDACGIKSIAIDKTSFTCSDVGANTVTLTVTDNNDNVSTCTATVTVIDTVKPNAQCQAVTLHLDASGNVSLTAAQVNNGSSDACGIKSIAIDKTSFTCSSVGANTVTLTVTDNNDNVSTCTSTVTVIDTVKPNAQCQAVTLHLDASGNVSLTAAQVNNGSSDACGIKSIAIDKTSFTCSNVGANTVTLTVTDNNDNVSTCTATVTVIDTVKPNAQCQAVTLHLDASGNVSLTAAQVNNGSSDACGIKSIAIDKTSFTCSDVGANTVTLTVTDNNDNVSTCTATVTVIDTVKPNAQCQAVTLHLDASGNVSLTAAQVNNGSSDACGIKSIAIDKTSFTCSNVGANTVTLTVTDNNDNVSTCTATVTVIDTVKPNAQCQAVTLHLDASGNVSLTAAQVNNGSSDACGIKSIAIDKTSFTCSNVGANTVTLTVTDNNDNVSTCTSTVTVRDLIRPTIVCPSDIIRSTDPGLCSAVVTFNVTGSDNCSGYSIVSVPASGTVFPKGTTSVKSIITDASGNKDSCVFSITVNDNEKPKVTCPANITTLTDSAKCSAVVNFSATATDNCPGVTVMSTPPSGFVFPKGTTSVKCVAIDAAGNRDSCTFTVTVNNPAPIASITGPMSGSIFAVGTAVSFTGTFTDNPRDVHIAQWMFDVATVNGTVNEVTGAANGSYTFTAAGVYFVKLTVTDQCGNASTATTIGGFDAMVVIYDPNAGFVTGGGWITSPTGAYRADTTLTGKANFGFVSKYKKGQSIPTGETEFQFKLGNVNFHSSSYDWLVISGAKAQYKGSGTINGTGNYAFILTAIDGQINGGGGIDKFRMKISNKSTSAIVYDNQFGKSDTSAPSTALGGGSIVIHTGGGGAAAGLHQRAPGDEGNSGGGLPTEFALQQNFPNPFNPSTLIKYQLPEASHVTLIIYNMIGQQVGTLIDGVEEAGYKSVLWNAESLPSGMYFYKIVAGSFSETRKMVLVR